MNKADLTPKEERILLEKFVESHPEAEKQVAYLIMKQLGIDKSTFYGSSATSMATTSDGGDESLLSSPFPLQRSDDTDILPKLLPVPWLSEDSWNSMSYNEKVGFMAHITNGSFRAEHLLPYIHSRYFPTAKLFHIHSDGMAFSGGKDGVDRVVLGHGPRRVLVLVGIHGNEPCGVNTRFLKKNLNRLFDTFTLCDDESAEEEGYKYELQRARLIAESIRDAEFVLDIHSCSADVGSFALPSSMDISEEVAERLPVKYVVESLVHACLDGGTTLDCALLHGVPGVCVECGQHSHPSARARAVSVISAFLSMQVLSERGSFATPNVKVTEEPNIMRCKYAERVGPQFEWLNQFPEFHFVPENTPIFRDKSRGDVHCPIQGGAYIVMPTASPVIGEEALFWATAKECQE
ncbi:hypothetical protein ACHAWF_008034 [Thalassiosira exigua]